MTDTYSEDHFSRHQRIFTRYTLAILLDLTVLNLFNEYWSYVSISDFSISLLAAILLQLLLQITIKIEHYIANYFKKIQGLKAKILRVLSTWLILFISKLAILELITIAFEDKVVFSGAIHGLVAFIIVVLAIILTEETFIRIYRRLA